MSIGGSMTATARAAADGTRLIRRHLLLAGAAPPALALYDPPPVDKIALAHGVWQGTLTCRDYSPPHRLVVLPTRLHVALAAPDELALHFVSDDGPAKRVDACDRIARVA